MNNRRTFIKSSVLALGATALGNYDAKAETQANIKNKLEIKQNDIILFQGDSITDNGRNRENQLPNDTQALGQGYAMLAASAMLNKYAEKNIKIYNRGISGHKVPQLQDRWQADCIDLAPSILSILIGVNDYWHKRDGNYTGSAQLYKEQYQKLLDNTLEKLPQVKLIIAEPFAVKEVKHVDNSWFPEFAMYQQAARDIAKEYKALLVPYQDIFDKACKRAPGGYWTTDGVHTTPAGADLMAANWLNCFK
ncbi:SGNH/GDSL hydrolase family protein [Sphingobacterium faecale]|uniref:SGNH/GDSL hydrolase family protein n=1 Tax=Sphingobacterium faecale TaxID=2803775 RepID=A0ABS1R0C1_9SPHI|nr:SGNH/GDSL hydrolase family protein [Sphingobacterium faecale]MBL1408141.1 SGNH/GDSL hydrolase family protein [Sphingobacterium faecale]